MKKSRDLGEALYIQCILYYRATGVEPNGARHPELFDILFWGKTCDCRF